MSQTLLRIALFTYSTKPRGSVIHTLELAEALHSLGHFVCVYALDKDGQGFDFPLSCSYHPVPAQSASTDIDELIRQRIQEFVDECSRSTLDYDCYHAQDCISANALAIVRQQQRIPHFVRTIHHIEDYRSLYLQHCQERSIREADLCLCVSEVWQKAIQERYQIYAPRVINGVNLERFSALSQPADIEVKQRLKLHGNPIYLTVGGIEPRKNSINLLKAFSQVLIDYPNALLVIAGGATLFDYQTYRSQFFTLVEQLGIAESLLLPGIISDSDLPALYRCADGFVFPSVQEGWGLVVLEAIASGLPVITSNHPPFTEFLSDTQAFLVDPNQPAAIAEAMRKITTAITNSLVEQSQSVLFNYTWATSARLHLRCYQSLLNA